MTIPESRRPSLATPFALALTLLQAAPWLLLLVNRVSLIACAAESIGYRYFHSFRILHGDEGVIWEAQGQTLGVLANLINGLLDLAHCSDLQQRIAWFGFGTLALNTAIFGVVIITFCRQPVVTWADRLLVGAIGLYGVYGSRWGMASSWLPDYYTLETTASVAALALFIVYLRTPDVRLTIRRVLWLGVLAGAMVGIKITLLPAALLPVVVLWGRELNRPARWVPALLAWGVATALTLAAVVAVYYRFDFPQLFSALQAWRTFVSNPGAEPGFVDSLLGAAVGGRFPQMHHLFFWFTIALWLVALGSLGVRLAAPHSGKVPDLLLGVYVIATTALHLLGLYRRPAETTLFECGLFLAAGAAALLAVLPAAGWFRRTVIGWTALLGVWTVTSAVRCLPTPTTLTILRTTGDHAWEIHRWLDRTEAPIIVYLPDNRYVAGTVEEALLKGFSDTPTWQITRGYDLLEKVAPRRQFVQQLTALPARCIVVWTDVPRLPALADTNPALRDALRHLAAPVRSWSMGQNTIRARTAHAAEIAQGIDWTDWRAIRSTRRWRFSSLEVPIRGFQVSPLEARPRIELRLEGGRRFVRITATHASPYLALAGDLTGIPDETGPLRLRTAVRVDRGRAILLQIYGTRAADGNPDNCVENASAPGGVWAVRLAGKAAVPAGYHGGNFSVALLDVQPGDWFDVADLSLYTPDSAPSAGVPAP